MELNSSPAESMEASDIGSLQKVLDCIEALYEECDDNEPVDFFSIDQALTIRELIELLNDTIEVVTERSESLNIFSLCIHGVPEESGLRESFCKWLENQMEAVRERGALPKYLSLPSEPLVDRLIEGCRNVRNWMASSALKVFKQK